VTRFINPLTGYRHDKPPKVPAGEVHPRFELASPYWPGASKEEPDSSQPLAVLRTLRSAWEELRAEDPDFFCGLTVHGSLVKGRSHSESDIDPVIYTNEGAAGDTLRKYGIEFDPQESYEPRSTAKDFVQTRFTEVLAKHAHAQIIPKSYLETNIWGNFILSDDYFEQVGPRIRKQTLWCLANYEGPFVPAPFTHLFHLNVGSGQIPEFRGEVLDILEGWASKKHPNLGQHAWSGLKRRLIQVEEWNRGATIYFPETIQEARNYFLLRSE
jgi:hypothetical protein